MDERLDEVIQEIQDENANTVPAYKVFRSMLNQPNLIGVSSSDGIPEAIIAGPLGQSSYYNFTCNLPRPALDVASVQLVSANIPQANANIPDTACMFWYYRLSAYSGQTPNVNNLYYNRLLPSTYKQEFVQTPEKYGWNRTFKSYKDLGTELAKIGNEDLTFNNWNEINQGEQFHDRREIVPYIPADISISLNTEMNKFQMKGNNIGTPPTFVEWVAETTYAKDDRVYADYYGVSVSWISLVNANLGYDPQDHPTFWKQDYNTVMAPWDASTNYGVGRYVTDGLNVYVSTYANATQNPSGIYTWSATQTYSRFQVVLDPSNNTLYTYSADIPKANNQPSSSGSTGWIATNWSSSVLYTQGFICRYDDTYYAALANTLGNQPDANPTRWTPIVFWTPVDTAETLVWNRYLITGYQDPNVAIAQGDEVDAKWTPYSLYEVGFIVDYQGNTPLVALWNSTTVYQIGDYVRHDDGKGTDATWKCVIAGTVNVVPGTKADNWNILFYEAETQNIGTPPLPLWDPTKTYDVGSRVLYQTSYYQSILSTPNNINKTPTSFTNYWIPIRTEWRTTTIPSQIYGFAYTSADTDFLQADIQQNPIIFPRGFYQPFAPQPKRLLNSILGFCWNGVFTASSFIDFNINPYNAEYFLTNEAVTPFLNRLRPVPIYDLLDEWDNDITYDQGERVQYQGIVYESLDDANLGNVPPSTLGVWWSVVTQTLTAVEQVGNIANLADTYTADAYANLVYSSIVYIYTSIVGGSTLDTKRNTNLLAITPMNAGNLGVAFSNQFVDNPLTKVFGDINAIYIELRDEFGEPYLMSNNAVITLTLKVKFIEEILPKDNT